MRIETIEDVVAAQLCAGCGACAYASPERFEMIDCLEHGRRPRRRPGAASEDDGDALGMCPGIGLAQRPETFPPDLVDELLPGWGPVLELWEGFASDGELRFAASSGGASSALALHAIERRGMHGLLHIRARRNVPVLNESVLSHTRDELMAATGSRYAPASPCDRLQEVEDAPGPCVFIGKPCDVAASAMARRRRPQLDEKLGLTVAIFCAGTPSLAGTLELLRRMGATDPSRVESLRYRGMGWPGPASAVFRDASGERRNAEFSYAESWGAILQEYRPWRCKVCADHSGEFADVAVCDPWYQEISPDEPGRSLILVRSERGREAVRAALDDGYIEAELVGAEKLPASQPMMLLSRGASWARIWTCRFLGVAAPRYRYMPQFRFWLSQLDLKEKGRSIIGTVRRIRSAGLRRRISCEPYDPGGNRGERDGDADLPG
jgi:coenzyme F420 hydrogenase subunit beta